MLSGTRMSGAAPDRTIAPRFVKITTFTVVLAPGAWPATPTTPVPGLTFVGPSRAGVGANPTSVPAPVPGVTTMFWVALTVGASPTVVATPRPEETIVLAVIANVAASPARSPAPTPGATVTGTAYSTASVTKSIRMSCAVVNQNRTPKSGSFTMAGVSVAPHRSEVLP